MIGDAHLERMARRQRLQLGQHLGNVFALCRKCCGPCCPCRVVAEQVDAAFAVCEAQGRDLVHERVVGARHPVGVDRGPTRAATRGHRRGLVRHRVRGTHRAGAARCAAGHGGKGHAREESQPRSPQRPGRVQSLRSRARRKPAARTRSTSQRGGEASSWI